MTIPYLEGTININQFIIKLHNKFGNYLPLLSKYEKILKMSKDTSFKHEEVLWGKLAGLRGMVRNVDI